MNAIQIQDLCLNYGKGNVLNNLSLTLEEGKIVGLMGPNGCGKSSLIKILAGVLTDYTGAVSIHGMEPGPQTKAITSYFPDKPFLMPWMKPTDAVQYFADFYADFDPYKASQMLQDFGLSPKQPMGTMSKGMQEKVQLALTMSRNARLFLLDEPLGGIDPATRAAILGMIMRNYQPSSTLVISTHLVHDIEPIFNYGILLGYGELILAGETDAIRASYGKTMEQIFREVFACLVSF